MSKGVHWFWIFMILPFWLLYKAFQKAWFLTIPTLLGLAAWGGISGLIWRYNVNTWIDILHINGHCSFWVGVLLGFVPPFCAIGLKVMVITWIVNLIF